MYMYKYMCIYIYMHICIYTYTYMCSYLYSGGRHPPQHASFTVIIFRTPNARCICPTGPPIFELCSSLPATPLRYSPSEQLSFAPRYPRYPPPSVSAFRAPLASVLNLYRLRLLSALCLCELDWCAGTPGARPVYVFFVSSCVCIRVVLCRLQQSATCRLLRLLQQRTAAKFCVWTLGLRVSDELSHYC